MDKEALDLEIRLMAIESIVASVLAGVANASPNPTEYLAKLRSQSIEQARRETFPGAAPEMSDHVSGEYEQNLLRLLDAASDFLRAQKSQ